MSEGTVTASPGDAYGSDIRTLKAEVDALQVHVMAANKPWYGQVSTLVAVIALMFSFVTTALSFARTADQDIRTQQVELRSLIQRLMALPKENIDLLTKYKNMTQESIMLSSAVNVENQILLRHAISIADQIPHLVSPVEYFAIAESLIASGNVSDAKRYYERVVDLSADRETAVGAYRSLAVIAYQSGDYAQSNRLIELALAVFESEKFGNLEKPPQVTQDWTHAQTHVLWAQKLVGLGARCEEVLPHVFEARDLMFKIPNNVVTQTLGESLNTLEASTARCPRSQSVSRPNRKADIRNIDHRVTQ